MGLSEREQQLLDDMERRLYQSEADVMQAPAVGSTRRLNLRSLVLGILVVLVGIGVLIGGVASQLLWLGLIGFAAMLGGAVLAFSKTDAAGSQDAASGLGGSSGSPSKGRAAGESLGDRMSRRWDQRMDGER
jgi:hypothetical protein